MSTIRVGDSAALRPLHVAILCAVFVVAAGGSWFLSAAESTTLVDGAVEWQVGSPLRAVVQLLCLNYQFPTVHAGAVKIYILGIGAGLATVFVSIAIAATRRGDEDKTDTEVAPSFAPPAIADSDPRPKTHIAALLAAQVLVGMYLLWSFASSRWSAAPTIAIGGSILLTTHFLWSFALGNALNPTAARIASRMIVAVTTVTAVMAIWYYYGRNPSLRAKFPFGNPNFLSACLIPGILLAVSLFCEKIARAVRAKDTRPLAAAGCAAGVIALGLWAFYLAGSRGPAIGLALGLLGILFFAVPRWWKLIPAGGALSAAVLGSWLLSSSINTPSPTGRDATLRLRLYTWSYALQMTGEKPVTGFGQGGFAMSGDSRVVNDVLTDPEVFPARIAHAHNEWLEIMADLGAVGLVLIAAALCLTLRAGMHALHTGSANGQRWALLGLMGALVGLVVEEAFGVGLRVSGVPTLFYTVIGLIWAMSGQTANLPAHLSTTLCCRVITGPVGVLVGLAVLVLTQQDFGSARNAYRAEQHLRAGEYHEAIRLADSATGRLNPHRALTNLYRLSEAHTLVAKKLQERAIDRESRAYQTDLVDQKLLALAREDRRQSDEHCVEGSRALKKLISCSPGFLNHGRVEYWLNLIQADNAAARQEPGVQELAIRNAAAAIERELMRQPFNSSVVLDYVNVPGLAIGLADKITVLARPLRYGRISTAYAETLAHLTSNATFDDEFAPIVDAAMRAVTDPAAAEHGDQRIVQWAPEILRLTAIIWYRRGNYDDAREAAEAAAGAYEALRDTAPLGAAGAYMELADCRFFSEPGAPRLAIDVAYQALALAPDSLEGRRLRDSVKQRLVEYYLADDREPEAKSVLQEIALPGSTEDMLRIELAFRYRRLCESLLGRRLASMLRQSPNDLLPKLQRWLQRSITLNPRDHLAYFRAADLAFHRGDCAATAQQLRRALNLGLAPDVVVQFLQVARQKRPNEAPLEALWSDLMQARQIDAPASPTRVAPPPPQNKAEP